MESFWFIAVVAGPILLGLALVYGIVAWRQRRVPDAARDAATRANYRAVDRR